MTQNDLLHEVVAALKARVGDLRQVAAATGISYDTVLRIKRLEGGSDYDPGYSKVRKLAQHLGLVKDGAPKRKRTQPQTEGV